MEFVELTGGPNVDVLDASTYTGVVTLRGGGGGDTLLGTSNADTLVGDADDDILIGGNGDDTYEFDADLVLGKDTIIEGAGGGFDWLDFSTTGSLGVTLTLGESADVNGVSISFTVTQFVNANLTLTLAADSIENIRGTQSADILIGSRTSNELAGEAGSDILVGGRGLDILDGGSGVTEAGDSYADTWLEGRNFSEVRIYVDHSRIDGLDEDTFTEIEVAHLTDTAGASTLDASVGFEGLVYFDGGDGADVLIGGPNGDTLIGGAGNDNLQGGLGDDTYRFNANSSLGTDSLTDTGGVDTLDFTDTDVETITLDLGIAVAQPINGNLTLDLNSGSEIENAIGGSLGDTLSGNSLDNTLEGGTGADVLTGLGGNDTLIGGDGDDRFVFDPTTALGTDYVLESLGTGGMDTLDFTSSALGIGDAATPFDLGKGSSQSLAGGNLTLWLIICQAIENFTGGSGADYVHGNSLDNLLIGNGGADVFDGELGDDTLQGNDDADELYGGEGNDKLEGGNGSDELNGGEDDDILEGDGGADTLLGENGNDRLRGGTGTDILMGGDDDDTYRYDVDAAIGAETITEAEDEGVDTIDFSATTTKDLTFDLSLITAQVVDLATANLTLTLSSGKTFENIVGGSGDDILSGNSQNNQIDGSAGTDTLIGRGGADTLIGGAGDDVLDGGAGDDTLWGEAGLDERCYHPNGFQGVRIGV